MSEGGELAVPATRVFSGGGAAREPEPGGGGDVSHAADPDGAVKGARGRRRGRVGRQGGAGGAGEVSHAADPDGAVKGARGGGRGRVVRQDEPGDAADGCGQGVRALRGEGARELRGGAEEIAGAAGGDGGAAPDRGLARRGNLRAAGASGEVRGGLSEGLYLGKDGAFRGDPGDDPQRGGAARAYTGYAPPGNREPAPLRGRARAGGGPGSQVHEKGEGRPRGDRGGTAHFLRPVLQLLRTDPRAAKKRRHP